MSVDTSRESDVEIRDESWRGFYAEIPRCVIRSDISHAALRLYCYYKDVTGPSSRGVCFKCEESIRAEIHMDGRTVRAKRQELIDKGFIRVKEEIQPNGSKRIIVSLVNVWDQNVEFCDELDEKRRMQNNTLPNKRTVQNNTSADLQNNTSADLQNNTSADLQNNTCKDNIIKDNNFRNNKKKNSTLSPGSDITRSDSSDGFFHEQNVDVQKRPYHQIAADKLYDGLNQKRLISNMVKGKTNLKKWAIIIKEFLDNNPHITKEEFKDTLKWYSVNAGEEFVPEAYSAKSFCEKYVRIKLAMKRSHKMSKGSRVHEANQRALQEYLKGLKYEAK